MIIEAVSERGPCVTSLRSHEVDFMHGSTNRCRIERLKINGCYNSFGHPTSPAMVFMARLVCFSIYEKWARLAVDTE